MMRSLRARLFAFALIFLTIALFMTWLALTRLFSEYVAEGYQRELQSVADTLVANLAVKDGKLVLSEEPKDPRFAVAAGGRYWQIDGAANESLHSKSLWDTSLKVSGFLKADSKLFVADGPSESPLLVLVQNVTLQSDTTEYPAKVQVAADRTEYDAALSSFGSRILGMLGLTGLFLTLASALQIFVGLRPLLEIRKSVVALRMGEVSHLDIKGAQEVRPLIAEINTLMADSKAAVTRARARASDLAHGLKTPLTVLNQLSETLNETGQSAIAGQMAEQVLTIRSRVDRQLALARAGNPGHESLDLGLSIERLIKAIKPLADEAGISIHSNIPKGLKLSADATDFLEAIGNVFDNAVRHACSEIQISAKKLDRTVCINIDDDGPGIPESNHAAALQRGRRLDEAGDGSGLGLAITSDILTAYGGSISLARSDKGGLSVQMDWPIGTGSLPL
jgi:signal transduction histidine kinase